MVVGLQWIATATFKCLPFQNGVGALQLSYGHWATLTLWSGTDSICPLETDRKLSKWLWASNGTQKLLSEASRLRMALVSSSCRIVALGDAMEGHRLHLSNGCSPPMECKNPHFQSLPVLWCRCPPAVVWSQCATLTLQRGADSILPLETLERFPNGLATPVDLQSHFSKSPGQEWRMAPSSCRMVAMCDTDPLERRRVPVAS